MKVYVITKGCYSDYHICGVTLDKTIAETMAKRFSDRYEDAEVEEYDTDKMEEYLKMGEAYYCYSKGNYIGVDETSIEDVHNEVVSWKEKLFTCVIANSKEEARKIASDRFAKYKAEKVGL